jgi:hypothetical protein
MPQIADWPPTRAEAQHILNQHPDAPPQHIHTCKVCGDAYWGIKHPVSHRIRSFCSKQCYHQHAEKNPCRSRWLATDKGKAVTKRKQTKYTQSEHGQLRQKQRQRWERLVLSLDPSQRPPNLDPWPTCTTPDCHNIPKSRYPGHCRSCRYNLQIAKQITNRPNTWTNAGKPCAVCSNPLTRYQHKTCSAKCEKERVQSCPKRRSSRRKTGHRRRARKRAAFVEDVDVMLHLQWQDNRCYHCNHLIRIDKAVPHPKSLTLDHLVPLALGGEHSYANTVASCFNCNCAIKGTRAIGEQLKLV